MGRLTGRDTRRRRWLRHPQPRRATEGCFTTGGGTWSKRWRIKTGTCPPDRDDYGMMEQAPTSRLSREYPLATPAPVSGYVHRAGWPHQRTRALGRGRGGSLTVSRHVRCLPVALPGWETGTHHWVEDRPGRDPSHRLPAIDSRGQTPPAHARDIEKKAPRP